MSAPVIWRRVLLATVVGHILFAVSRVPRVVVGRRLEQVADYRERGGARFHLDNKFREGAQWVEWIQQNVPPDAAVLYRGPVKGPLEFVSGLIHPRLLCDAARVPPGAETAAGRPIARGRIAGLGEGQVVLVIVLGEGARDRVELELR